MDPEHPSPQRIGAYRIERRLGRGGMGEVFLAYDERLDRRVAIKRIRRDLEESPERRRRFRREARSAARVSHPSIVRIYDILEDDDGDCIVMEYVEGRPLSSELRAGLPGARAVSLARQLTAGLEAAHDNGLVHRDLKAENVIVSPSGDVKILDFGLAKQVSAEGLGEGLTREGAIVGTSHSMSPEQAGGETVDERSDLFSLGVLFYEMFTGRSPFMASSAAQTLRRILSEDPVPPRALRPELPEPLAQLIQRMLSKQPENRPQSASEVTSDLKGLERQTANLGPPPGAAFGSVSALAGSQSMTSPAQSLTPPLSVSAGEDAFAPETIGGGWSASRRIGLALVLLAAAGLSALLLSQVWPGEPSRLRILVLGAAVAAGSDDEAQRVSFALQRAIYDALASFERVDPVLYSRGNGPYDSPGQAAQAVSADEALQAELECRQGDCWVSMLRADSGEAGVILGGTPAFEVAGRPEYSLELARAVRRNLAQLYSGYLPRGVSSDLAEVSQEGYLHYLQLRRSSRGRWPTRADLEEAEAILDDSPRFVSGCLLAAEFARSLGEFRRAIDWARQARRLAPDDPRPLRILAMIETLRGRLEEAETALSELERLAPGDIRGWRERARLLQARGRTSEAIEVWRNVVERRPHWRYLLELADLEISQGAMESAGLHIGTILDRDGENIYALEMQARLHLFSGRLDEAQAGFSKIIDMTDGQRGDYFIYLGWTQILRRDYDQAQAAYARTLELQPGDWLASLGLATVEAVRSGESRDDQAQQGARTLYRELSARLENASLQPWEIMIKAECLARLGRGQDALLELEEARRALAGDFSSLDMLYKSSLIHALVGDFTTARIEARQALEKGLSPLWFRRLPAFGFLSDGELPGAAAGATQSP